MTSPLLPVLFGMLLVGVICICWALVGMAAPRPWPEPEYPDDD